MLTVICYDIVEDRTRNRVAKMLLDYANRVQNSVFECHHGKEIIHKVISEAEKEIDPDTDSVILYSVCGECCKKEVVIGKKKSGPIDMSYIII